MINLFRRFRQKLINSGSATKCLLYAIGEILLVVVSNLSKLIDYVENTLELIESEQQRFQ